MAELTAPVIKADEERQIVYGPVLVPNEPDTDGDVVTPEKIEDVAHKFMEQYGNIDLQHSLNNVGKVIESYILPFDWEIDKENTIPAGSWIMGVKVQDSDTWDAVKGGALTGFSIMGISKMAYKSAKSTATKRTTLADLGDDWIVNAVSLVDEPAVPKAKFIAIKSKAQKSIEGSLEELRDIVGNQVRDAYAKEKKDVWVRAVLADSVVFNEYNPQDGTEKTYQIGYSIDENNIVTLAGDPVEVRVKEVVEPIAEDTPTNNTEGANSDDNDADNQIPSNEEKAVKEANKSLMQRMLEKLGLKSTEKSGRRISDVNYQKLKNAMEVIGDLLKVAEEERAKKEKGEDSDMKQEDVQAMIDESIKSVNDKVEEILNTLKSGGEDSEQTDDTNTDKDTDTEKDTDKDTDTEKEDATDKDSETETDTDTEDDTVSKSEYDEVLQELDALKRRATPFSRRLTGQDGETAEKSKTTESDRNAFGFKCKKSE